jgi:hypothetical protein
MHPPDKLALPAALDGEPADLDWLLEIQSGVATATQLEARGVTPGRITAQVTAGRWQRAYRGVVVTHGGSMSYLERAWGAVLWAGNGAMVSHQTAGFLLGLIKLKPTLVHVAIPEARRLVAPQGVVVHRATWPTIDPRKTLPQTTVERTTLDLVSEAATADEVVAVLSTALQRRLTTATRLTEVLDRLPKLRLRRVVRELLGVELNGVRSPLEWRYATHVERAHGLPRAQRQQHHAQPEGLHTFRDATYAEFGLVVELDGRIGHREVDAFRDMARDNRTAELGGMTLRYGWVDVTTRPCVVAVQVARVLTIRGWPGVITSCGPGCLVGTAR